MAHSVVQAQHVNSRYDSHRGLSTHDPPTPHPLICSDFDFPNVEAEPEDGDYDQVNSSFYNRFSPLELPQLLSD